MREGCDHERGEGNIRICWEGDVGKHEGSGESRISKTISQTRDPEGSVAARARGKLHLSRARGDGREVPRGASRSSRWNTVTLRRRGSEGSARHDPMRREARIVGCVAKISNMRRMGSMKMSKSVRSGKRVAGVLNDARSVAWSSRTQPCRCLASELKVVGAASHGPIRRKIGSVREDNPLSLSVTNLRSA